MNQRQNDDEPKNDTPPAAPADEAAEGRGKTQFGLATVFVIMAGLGAGLATPFSEIFTVAILCLVPLLGLVQSPPSLILRFSRPFVVSLLAGVLVMTVVRGFIIPRPPDAGRVPLPPPTAEK